MEERIGFIKRLPASALFDFIDVLRYYKNHFKRLAAYAVDMLSVIICSMAAGSFLEEMIARMTGFSINRVAGFTGSNAVIDNYLTPLITALESTSGMLIGMIIVFPLYSLIEVFHGASLGKLVAGIRIRNIDGMKAGIPQLFLRYIIKNVLMIGTLLFIFAQITIISMDGGILGLVIFLGSFLVLGKSKLALHDLFAKTTVYRFSKEVQHTAYLEKEEKQKPSKKRTGKGFLSNLCGFGIFSKKSSFEKQKPSLVQSEGTGDTESIGKEDSNEAKDKKGRMFSNFRISKRKPKTSEPNPLHEKEEEKAEEIPNTKKFTGKRRKGGKKTKIVWGLDISGNSLKAVQLSVSQGIPFVECIDIIDYPTLSPEENLLETSYIEDAVQTFLSRHRVTKNCDVLVSIPGQLTLSRFSTVPAVKKKQLKGIVTYEAQQQIPFDLSEIIWDYQLLQGRISNEEGMEVGLFASKKTTLENIINNMSPLGLNLKALQVSPLAIANFFFFDQQLEGPTVIVNLEEANTDLIIIDGANFWLRTIPLSIVDDDFVKEMKRSMQYYESLSKGTIEYTRLYLTGNGFKDPAYAKFIADNFAFDVKIFDTLGTLKLSDTVDAVSFRENLLNFNVALGLAIQGAGLGQIDINLLPPEQIKAALISEKKPYAIASLSCLILAFITQYYGMHMNISKLNVMNEHHQTVLRNTKNLERKYRDTETLAQKNKSELNTVFSIDQNRFFWIEVLDEIISSIPDEVSINSILSLWIDEHTLQERNTVRLERMISNTPSSRARALARTKAGNSQQQTYDTSEKWLLMGIAGESRDPSIGFIEKNIVEPIKNITLSDKNASAFKDVQIVPGSCRQLDQKTGESSGLCFEIRWVVKTPEEIQAEIESMSQSDNEPSA